MNMISKLFFEFLVAFIIIGGFSFLFNIEKKAIPASAFGGAIGWVCLSGYLMIGGHYIFANLIGAMVVAFFSETFARIQKNPSTIYLVPGILPLVPGLRIYNTVMYLIKGNYEVGVQMGVSAFFIGLAIAIGIITTSSFISYVYKSNKYINIKNNKK